MHLKNIVAALVAFSSLAAAAPAQDSRVAVKRQDQKQNQGKNNDKNNNNNNNNKNANKNNNNNNNNNGNINIIQNIIRPNIIVVQENLDAINQLQRQNEQELAALVQSQLALATQLQTVKDNIRINHFKAQFPQANTVIVTVTGLVDNRNQGQQNQRYLVNQLLADNGVPGNQTLVMVTDPTPMQISTLQAASSQANAFGAANVALENAPAVGGSNNSNAQAPNAAPADDSTLSLAAFNQAAPFGQIGQSVILPAGTQAPQLTSVPDPAAIILPGQQGLFVQNAGTFLSDCATTAAGGNQALAGVAAQIFSSFQQIAAAQYAALSGLSIYQGNNAAQPQPAAAQPPAQPAAAPQTSAPPAQAVAAPPPESAPAPQPAAAIAVGANQAAGTPAPQGATGSGVVIVGSSPGGQSAAQPQAAPAPAPAPAVSAAA
ncbi:uncharacterized protein ColSpa_03862 [Colletotrichum spaethianum]|uniref:Cas1p-like protein n=1 Tax=Colletotrichum spaethianum TaxID=700344 RepID=A0AA37L8B5_9PEZI|nr:uncharacterized protein ColSpa_03862 [Colletotrichum spaethianum]GKT43681.1 hypothetical protein ColSpa_03862 [Colletotrichum spaethianum]